MARITIKDMGINCRRYDIRCGKGRQAIRYREMGNDGRRYDISRG